MTIEKQTLLETILFADVKEGGTKMNNIALLKTEFKIIFRKKLTTFLSIILPVGFIYYLLFTRLTRRGETAVL